MARPIRSRRIASGIVVGALLLGGLSACSDDADTNVDEELEDLGSTVSSLGDDAEDTATSIVDELEDDTTGTTG
ncbi:MAG: hypothetical protein GEV08_24550 [Acidimicrobiia bacterium]|nr:hypothetical protein [Acidimicrobiia bacterium]